MAVTSDNSVIDRGFMKAFYDRIKQLFATKQETYVAGASITVTSNYDSGALFHLGKKATDTVDGVQNVGVDGLFIDKSVSTVYFDYTDGKATLLYVFPMGSEDFPNGKRLTLIGKFETGQGYGTYTIDPYAYSKLIVTDTASQLGYATTITEYADGVNAHFYRPFKMDFIYWNKQWYSDGYDVTLATDTIHDAGSRMNNLPITASGVSSLVSGRLGNYLPLSGGTMTGTESTIIIPGTDSRKTTYSSSDTEHLVATSGWAMEEKWKTADDSTILWRTGARGSDGTSMRYYYQGTDYNAPKIKTLGNGDTGYVGAVTIGMTTNSNNTITGGCKQVYNSTDKCLDFIF